MTASNTKPADAAALLRKAGTGDDARRQAAAILGSASSERKAAAVRENGKKAPPGPGRTPRPIAAYDCTCDAGDALEGHRWDCPRGKAIKRRKKAGAL